MQYQLLSNHKVVAFNQEENMAEQNQWDEKIIKNILNWCGSYTFTKESKEDLGSRISPSAIFSLDTCQNSIPLMYIEW